MSESVPTAREQLGERIAHAQQARARRGAVVDDIEPVLVTEIARLGPFVVADFDTAAPGASLDLDAATFAIGMIGQQIEAGSVGQPGAPRLLGPRHVFHLGAGMLFMCDCDPDGDCLHFGVETVGVLGILGGYDEGVHQELHVSSLDGVRFGV